MEEYQEKERFISFLSVIASFERGELSSKIGAMRTGAHRQTGISYTKFEALNGQKIQVEIKCRKSRKQFFYYYVVSHIGHSGQPTQSRDDALKQVATMGGYNRPVPQKQVTVPTKEELYNKADAIVKMYGRPNPFAGSNSVSANGLKLEVLKKPSPVNIPAIQSGSEVGVKIIQFDPKRITVGENINPFKKTGS